MRPQTLVPAIAALFLACGNTTGETGTSAVPGVDAGTGATVASAGGRPGSSGAGGSTPGAGGSSSGGMLGAGGAVGAGGATIDCSNVGCGAPPMCGQPCGAPCGCCPCTEGEQSGPNVCVGGCFAPASDASAACDPKTEEHRRRYLESSPAGCAVVRFTCPANTTVFFNACGCGCEQRAICPDTYSCQPAPMIPACNVQKIQTECPYSDILL